MLSVGMKWEVSVKCHVFNRQTDVKISRGVCISHAYIFPNSAHGEKKHHSSSNEPLASIILFLSIILQ